MTLQRQGDDVVRVGKNVKTADGPTEIDIQMKSGSTIEVKNGKLDSIKDIDEQIETQLMYRRENSLSGNHYIKAGGEITEEVRTWLEKKNVRILNDNSNKYSISTLESADRVSPALQVAIGV
ncbi:hypothetical protein [Halorhabdus sp. SVX81]|uniref:hypothetical protein n=1 Tax=Halorhabdus sp. SVX81 TaxID=2978283 RepID=UPI0023DBB770|nr:hypothetical protein [Halorhabdus sp. SVX81]